VSLGTKSAYWAVKRFHLGGAKDREFMEGQGRRSWRSRKRGLRKIGIMRAMRGAVRGKAVRGQGCRKGKYQR